MRPFSLLRLSIVAVSVLLLAGCRGPRDPALDQRIAEAGVGVPSAEAAAAPSEQPRRRVARSASSGSTGASGSSTPPAGEVVLRTYGKQDIAEIMGDIPGEGSRVAATLVTGEGEIRCTLAADAAPQTVANFVALVRGLRAWRDPDTQELMRTRFYDGLTFHRTIGNFIIQTGRPGIRGGTPGWRIPREEGLPSAYEEAGAMAMVDAGDDSHGSQFFITLRPAKQLADRYTPFGQCEGLDVARAIANAEKHPAEEGKSATRPVDPVRVERIEIRRE